MTPSEARMITEGALATIHPALADAVHLRDTDDEVQ